MAENVFDLLPKDHDCFIYEDILNQIDNRVGGYSLFG
jgi:hypothetical protein